MTLLTVAQVAARTILALSRGVTPGTGCRCKVCGPSPFQPGGKLADGFTDRPGAPEMRMVDAAEPGTLPT